MSTEEKEYYLISKDDLKKFIESQLQIELLEDMGVDNWDGYGEAMKEAKERFNRDIDDILGDPFVKGGIT